jgi:hypothetical protein
MTCPYPSIKACIALADTVVFEISSTSVHSLIVSQGSGRKMAEIGPDLE